MKIDATAGVTRVLKHPMRDALTEIRRMPDECGWKPVPREAVLQNHFIDFFMSMS
jgi:hypothetical protein